MPRPIRCGDSIIGGRGSTNRQTGEGGGGEGRGGGRRGGGGGRGRGGLGGRGRAAGGGGGWGGRAGGGRRKMLGRRVDGWSGSSENVAVLAAEAGQPEDAVDGGPGQGQVVVLGQVPADRLGAGVVAVLEELLAQAQHQLDGLGRHRAS